MDLLKALLNLLQYCFCFMFQFWVFFFSFFCCEACGILAPWAGIKPIPLCVGRRSLNHWTTEEVPDSQFSRSVMSNSLWPHGLQSTPGFPGHPQLPELAQTHVHQVGDAIQPCHPLSSPSPPAFNLSQHQGLFQESVVHIRWPKY